MLNSFSISFGKKAAKPDMRNPSLAPAKLNNVKVGLTISCPKARGISRSFRNDWKWLLPWASEIFSVRIAWDPRINTNCQVSNFFFFFFLLNDLPGKKGGRARIGKAIAVQTTAARTNPTHHAPTHTLLLGVSPKLKKKKIKHEGKVERGLSSFAPLFKLSLPLKGWVIGSRLRKAFPHGSLIYPTFNLLKLNFSWKTSWKFLLRLKWYSTGQV